MPNKYYFTYGTSESMPYKGGWTEVHADNINQAVALFDAVHPRKSEFVNCSSIYTEEQFIKTSMFIENDNFGAGCREIISLNVTLID